MYEILTIVFLLFAAFMVLASLLAFFLPPYYKENKDNSITRLFSISSQSK